MCDNVASNAALHSKNEEEEEDVEWTIGLRSDTGMPVRTETLAMTELQQQLLQVCANNWAGTRNSRSNEGRQAKNGGVKGRDWVAEELDRETAMARSRLHAVGRTRRKDGG